MSNVPQFTATPVEIVTDAAPTYDAPQITILDESQTNPVANGQLFTKLLPFSWKGVSFPTTDFKVELVQDLAAHKFADLDSAEMEPTGRESLKFNARIPFLNNIARAPSEDWPAGALYPDQFKAFFAACVDRSPGMLVHPHFGGVFCVLERCSVDWKAQTRDGVYVDVTWLETFDTSGEINPNISGGGQISMATQAGIDLDTLLPTLPSSSFPQLPKSPPSFADFARQLQGVADTISLQEYQFAGQLDNIAFQVQNVMRSINQATHSGEDAQNSVQAWMVRDAADRYLSALNDVKKTLLSQGKTIGVYIPVADTTLPMLAQTIPAPVGDLLALNPSLLTSYLVPRMTRVRYYI